MTRPALMALLVLAGLPTLAWAQPSMVAAQAFVSNAGYAAADIGKSLAGTPSDAAGVTPVELILAMLDAREQKTVWRARYLVRVERRQIGGDTLDMIEAQRFNLAVPLRSSVLRDKGTADSLQSFGIGPHVAWRMVVRPDGPNHSTIVALGRRDFLDMEAKELSCVDRACLDPDATIASRGDWKQTRQSSGPPSAAPYKATSTSSEGHVDLEEESPAHAAREMMVASGLATGDNGVKWVGPPSGTTAQLLFDRNVSSDDGSEGMVGPVPGTKVGWLRRVGVVSPGPEIAVTLFEGTLRRR